MISVYFQETGIVVVLKCFGKKNLIYASIPGIIRECVFLRHCCEHTGYYDYKPIDFYLAVTESDSSYKNFVCNIASNKQIETCKFYNMNQNSIIDLMKRYNKNKFILYCRKCGPDLACQDEYKLNPDELPPLIVSDDYLYVEETI